MHDRSCQQVVLVVDDEAFVLNTVCSMLAHAGYSVLRAASVEAALEIARTYTGTLDLLVSDVIMPRMSGPTLADRILDLHPEAACLFIAGLPDSPEIEQRIIQPGRPFLAKPFFHQTLIAKVQDVLNPRAISVAASGGQASF
jgi:CheY-like chemotaxis protein